MITNDVSLVGGTRVKVTATNMQEDGASFKTTKLFDLNDIAEITYHKTTSKDKEIFNTYNVTLKSGACLMIGEEETMEQIEKLYINRGNK